MNRLDLIIDALYKTKLLMDAHGQYPHTLREVEKALAAARELKALKPVGYMDGKGVLFNNTTHPHLNTALYALEAALAQPEQAEYDKLTVKFGERAKEYLEAAKKSWEPEQAPVAWLYNGHLHECDPSEWAVTDVIPLYKLPPHKPWVGLTDDEINTIANSPQPIDETSNGYVLPFAHAIQSRLKEKNT